MSLSKTERRRRRAARLFAGAIAAIGLGTALAGCSDLYLDRRDTIAQSGGDAVAANTVTQEVDPWPAYSGDRDIAFNGQRMQAAVDRYRAGKVIPPADPESFMSSNQSGQTINQTTVNTGGPPAAAGAAPQ
jgi:hypothetical protein